VRLSARVTCFGGANVRVLKWMEVRYVNGVAEVMTVFYQYQAWLPQPGRRREQTLVRYDEAHRGTPHRHEHDRSGHQVAHDELTLEAMPRLDSVIREAAAMAAAFSRAPR
jgi:hypothetical protein